MNQAKRLRRSLCLCAFVIQAVLLSGCATPQPAIRNPKSPILNAKVLRPTSEILDELRKLSPLPKVHLSFAVRADWLVTPAPSLAIEYARISRALCVRGELVTAAQLAAAARICTAADAALGVQWGRTHNLAALRQRLRWIRDTSEIPVEYVILDDERSAATPRRAEDHRAAAAIVADVLPAARLEWYGYRGQQRVPRGNGWGAAPWHDLRERHPIWSVALYRVPELGYTREAMRRTVAEAARHGVRQVTAWIALGSGYRRTTGAIVDDRQQRWQEWSYDWDYDTIYSWQLGFELNQPWFSSTADRRARFAPWSAADVVVFYPCPFNEKAPAWGKHFVAYVRGANGVR